MSKKLTQVKQGLLLGAFGLGMGGLALLIRPSPKQMGILQMDSFQYEESENLLLSAYQKKPYDLVTLRSLARIYEILGHPDQEIRYLNEYLTLQPKDTATRLHLAKVYLWNLQQKAALDQYQNILLYEPENIDVIRKLATSYTWEQKHDLAIDCYRRISQLGKLTIEDQRALIQLYIGTTQLELALSLMEKIHRNPKAPLNIDDFLTLADLYSWTGHGNLSDSVMARMLDELEDVWDVRIAFVEWYMNIVKPERAIFWLERWSRRPDKLQLQSHERLVEILQAELKEYEAIASMERLITHPEATEKHRVQLFWMYLDANEADKSWKLGTSFSDEMIDRHDLLRSLIFLAMEFQDLDRAEHWAKRWVARNPNLAEGHQQLFTIYDKREKHDLAMAELTWLLSNNPQDPSTLQLAVDYFVKQQNLHEALDWAQKGRNLKGDPRPFLEAIVSCGRQLEAWEITLEPSLELIKIDPSSFDYGMGLVDCYLQLALTEPSQATSHRQNALNELDRLWSHHQDQLVNAVKIAEATSWAKDYKTAFGKWKDLEAREPLIQYEQQQLEAAVLAKEYTWALSVLEIRQNLPIFDQQDFQWMLSIYQELQAFQKEYDLISAEESQAFMQDWPREQRRSELLFNLDRGNEAIDILIAYYEGVQPNSEELRQEILEKTMWLKDSDKQLQILSLYGNLTGPDGIFVAEIYAQQKKFEACLIVLNDLQADVLQSLKAQELLYWCSAEIDDRDTKLSALANIIALESDPVKKVAWQVEASSLHHQMGHIEEAGRIATNILTNDPSNQRAMVILGYVKYDLKRYPEAAELLKLSNSQEVHDRFLRGASLLRFNAGYREGVRVFHRLLDDFKKEESFKKWNLVLDVGYELNSPFHIERAWTTIMEKYRRDEVLPRYALHLMYTDRRARAEAIFNNLKPSPSPSYQALLKMLKPSGYKGILSEHEKIALSEFSNKNGKWMEATEWLP